jgi:hypothetical protein
VIKKPQKRRPRPDLAVAPWEEDFIIHGIDFVGFIYIVWCEHTQITGHTATPLVNNNNEVYKNIWKQYQDNIQ